jgi:hypothetical protein
MKGHTCDGCCFSYWRFVSLGEGICFKEHRFLRCSMALSLPLVAGCCDWYKPFKEMKNA